MGDVLGWDEAERARQVDLYEQMRRAEHAALQENDEDTAQRLREGAGNPYPQQRAERRSRARDSPGPRTPNGGCCE